MSKRGSSNKINLPDTGTQLGFLSGKAGLDREQCGGRELLRQLLTPPPLPRLTGFAHPRPASKHFPGLFAAWELARHPGPWAPCLSDFEPATGGIPLRGDRHMVPFDWCPGPGITPYPARSRPGQEEPCSPLPATTSPARHRPRDAPTARPFLSCGSEPAHRQVTHQPVTMVPPFLKMCPRVRVALFSFCPSSCI